MELLNNAGKRNIEFLSDIELDNPNINDIESQLTEEDEIILNDIINLEQEISDQPNLMHDILEAVKKGALDYLNSMTDTGETFDISKNPEYIKKWNESEIKKTCKPTNSKRLIKDANKNPFDNESKLDTSGMSEKGKIKLELYTEAYRQRTKSQRNYSTDGNIVKRSDSDTNFETLSGLRTYRFGPVVEVPPMDVAKIQYEKYVKKMVDEGKENKIKTPSNWLYEENLKQYDNALMKKLGFKDVSEATEFRKANNLTVHEGPDGMFLVPTDIHDTARHDGYRTIMSKYIEGKITKQELNQYIIQEKIAHVKHETQIRATRLVKGIGLSAVKDLMKHSIIIVCKETYCEFKEEKKDNLIHRIRRILLKCYESVKAKAKYILSNIWNNIKGSILSEFLTALNDFIFGIFKNIFKIIRQMWGSIKSAFKIITSKESSWEDRIFEASKVLSAGIVGIIGFSLNELIEKGLMSIGIPFASFIAECLSGLFSGIMSALVLMLFDHTKKTIQTSDKQLQLALLKSKSITIDVARIEISTIKMEEKMYETYKFFGNTYNEIKISRDSIIRKQIEISNTNSESKFYLDKEEKHINNLKNLLNNGTEF